MTAPRNPPVGDVPMPGMDVEAYTNNIIQLVKGAHLGCAGNDGMTGSALITAAVIWYLGNDMPQEAFTESIKLALRDLTPEECRKAVAQVRDEIGPLLAKLDRQRKRARR